LWRRATELQRAATNPELDGEEGAGVLPPEDPDAIPVDRVLAAAEEAGIPTENVLLAMAERDLSDAQELDPDRRSARWLRKWVSETDAIEVSQVLRASVEEVVQATERVTATDTYRLGLENRWGNESQGPVVLAYRNQGVSLGMTSWFHSNLELGDGRVLLVTLHRVEDGTHLRIRLPLYRRDLNLALAGGSMGLFGFGGTAGAASVGNAVAGLMGVAAVPAAVALGVAGALVGAGVGRWGFQRLYGWGCGKGRAAVGQFAKAVAMEVAEATPGRRFPQETDRLLPDEGGKNASWS